MQRTNCHIFTPQQSDFLQNLSCRHSSAEMKLTNKNLVVIIIGSLLSCYQEKRFYIAMYFVLEGRRLLQPINKQEETRHCDATSSLRCHDAFGSVYRKFWLSWGLTTSHITPLNVFKNLCQISTSLFPPANTWFLLILYYQIINHEAIDPFQASSMWDLVSIYGRFQNNE